MLVDFDSFYKASENELLVLSDRELLNVLFYNLIENAIKYSPENSTVQIKGELLDENLRITVSDEGDGIDAENIDKIFDRFYRQEKSATKYQGSGLGLAICKKVADSLNAKIWAETVEHRTSFYFQIPRGQ